MSSVTCEGRLSRIPHEVEGAAEAIRAVVPTVAFEVVEEAVTDRESRFFGQCGGAPAFRHVCLAEARGDDIDFQVRVPCCNHTGVHGQSCF